MTKYLLRNQIEVIMLHVLLWCQGYGQDRGRLRVHFSEEIERNSLICNIKDELIRMAGHTNNDLSEKKMQVLVGNSVYLSLDETTGAVKTKLRIDREGLCDQVGTCCDASDSAENCKLSLQIALIPKDSNVAVLQAPEIIVADFIVIDINDHSPSWPTNVIHLDIPEHTTIGSKFKLPSASDPDQEPNSTFRYELRDITSHFSLEVQRVFDNKHIKHNVFIKLIDDVDHESRASFIGKLLAIDGGNPPRTGSVSVQITVTDINDHPPKFKVRDAIVTVMENSKLGQVIASALATDLDPSDQHRLSYRLGSSASQEVSRAFSVDSQNGDIVLVANLDYEKIQSYHIPIRVTDGKHVEETTFIVKVENQNDNTPRIIIKSLKSNQNGVFEVAENMEPNQFIASVFVEDDDDRNGQQQVTCSIENNNFEIRPFNEQVKNMFKIVTATTFDREKRSNYYAMIKCLDGGNLPQSATQSIQIKILDENDCPPVFQSNLMIANLKETAEGQEMENNVVIQIVATDQDEGINSKISYSIDLKSQDSFVMNSTTGEIRARRGFDRETTGKSVNLTIYAQDCAGMPQSSIGAFNNLVRRINTATATLMVIIQDVNDCDPEFDVPPDGRYKFVVREGAKNGHVVGQVKATDNDIDDHNRRIHYFQQPSSNSRDQHFNVQSNGIIVVKIKDLDREQIANYEFVVVAEDEGLPAPRRATAKVTIKVEDVNDNAPQWIFPSSSNRRINVSIDETVGHRIVKLHATDIDEGRNGKVEFTLIKSDGRDLFEVRAQGDLILKRSITEEDAKQMYKLVIKASDCAEERPQSALNVVDIYIIRNFNALQKNSRHVESNLIIIITMIAVTLVISLLLIAAIVFLRCTVCAKLLGIQITASSGHFRSGQLRGGGPRSRTDISYPIRTDFEAAAQYKVRLPPTESMDMLDKHNTIITNEGKVLLNDTEESLNSTRLQSAETGAKTELGIGGVPVGFLTYRNASLGAAPSAIDSKRMICLNSTGAYTSPRLTRFRCRSTDQINRAPIDRTFQLSTGQLYAAHQFNHEYQQHQQQHHLHEEEEAEDDEAMENENSSNDSAYQNVQQPPYLFKESVEVSHNKTASSGTFSDGFAAAAAQGGGGGGGMLLKEYDLRQYTTLKHDDSGNLFTLQRVSSPTKVVHGHHLRQPTSFV